MVYSICTKVRYFTVAALLLGVVLFTSAWTPSAYAADSAKVTNLLQQARASATQLQRDAELMQTYTRSQISWQTHAAQINTIKEHINKIGTILADLHDARDGASPWQQDAIDGITPQMHQLADHTTSIIEHLNDRNQTWHPEYRDYLHANAELAADVAKTITDYISYGKARARLQA